MVRRKKSSSLIDIPSIRIPKGTSFTSSIYPDKPKKDTRRSFTSTQKKEILYQQNNKCASSECKHKTLDPRATHFHHAKPWASGGRTITANGRALCADCHEIITHKERLRQSDKKRKPRSTNLFF